MYNGTNSSEFLVDKNGTAFYYFKGISVGMASAAAQELVLRYGDHSIRP